jgi:hypothetical protein
VVFVREVLQLLKYHSGYLLDISIAAQEGLELSRVPKVLEFRRLLHEDLESSPSLLDKGYIAIAYNLFNW